VPVVLSLAAGGYLLTGGEWPENPPEWAVAQKALEKLPDVRGATVTVEIRDDGRQLLEVRLLVDHRCLEGRESAKDEMQQAADIVVKGVPDLAELDGIRVTLIAGYHLGIVSRVERQHAAFDRAGKIIQRHHS